MNLAIGTIGIYSVFTYGKSYACYFVILACFFDFFDGFTARLLKVNSNFGKELDSLADLVSFGLLPSFFMLIWLKEVSSYFYLAILISIFSGIRLANFNTNNATSSNFKGLPTPANALMLTSLIFLPRDLNEVILVIITLLSCVLLISNVPLIALKFRHYRWIENKSKWILIIGTLGLVLWFGEAFLPFIIPFYTLVSIFSLIVK